MTKILRVFNLKPGNYEGGSMKHVFLSVLLALFYIPVHLNAASTPELHPEDKPVEAADGSSGLGRTHQPVLVKSFFSFGIRGGIGISGQTEYENFQLFYESKSPKEGLFLALDMYFTLLPFLRIKVETGIITYKSVFYDMFQTDYKNVFHYYYTLLAPSFHIKNFQFWAGISWNTKTKAENIIKGKTYENTFAKNRFFSLAFGTGYEWCLSQPISVFFNVDFRYSLVSAMEKHRAYLWGVYFSLGFVVNILKRGE